MKKTEVIYKNMLKRVEREGEMSRKGTSRGGFNTTQLAGDAILCICTGGRLVENG